MRLPTAVCVLVFGVSSGTPAAAQINAPGPPGPYVIDIRGAAGGIPQDSAFFPPVPAATIIPSSGFGIEVGAHVYLIQLGPARLGIGASALLVRGTASPAKPATPASGSTAATSGPPTRPDVNATLIDVAPQLSLNFGSAEGWSYVSAGVGRAQMLTGTSAFGGGRSGTTTTPAQEAESGTLSSTNVGGGARWFVKSHMAFSFDVRFHLVSAGAGVGGGPATPSTKLIVAAAGISLR